MRAVLAHASGDADRPQPPLGRDGRDHRDRHGRAGLQLAAPEHQGAAAAHPEDERVRDGPVRQVPRGPGLADLAHGPVRRLAGRRRGLRVLLRLHRRRGEPVRPGALRGPDAGRAAGHGRGGLPPHRGHDRPRHRLGAPAEGADAREALLRLLRAGRRPRPAPRAEGVGRQVQGPLRPGLGQAARGDVRAAEEAGRHRAGRRAHEAPRRDPRVGRDARADEAGARAPDGGLRRVPGAHRPPHRPPDRRPRGPRRAREHARLLHLRRQRRVGGRHAQRRLQRDVQLQRHGGPRDAGVHAVEDRRVRLAHRVQPLLGGLGVGDERALPVDEAGGVALGRDAQRHDRALAEGDQGARRAAPPVHPRDRRGPDGPRGRGPAGADHGQRRAAVADGRHQLALQLQRREGGGAARPPVLRDGRQPRHLLQGLERGHQAPDALDPDGPEAGPLRRGRLGAVRRQHRTGRRRATSRRSGRTCCRSCSGCS